MGCLSLDPPLPHDAPEVAEDRSAPVQERLDAAPHPTPSRAYDGEVRQEPSPQTEARNAEPAALDAGRHNPSLTETVDSPIIIATWTAVDAVRMGDIGVGAAGVAWAVGRARHPTGAGRRIYRLGDTNPVDGAATRVAVAPDGPVWFANDHGQIYRLGNGQWTMVKGCARDIGAGKEDIVWFIGCDRHPLGGGQRIYRLGDPQPMPGSAVRIAVSPSGSPWVVNDAGKIYRWRDGEWLEVSGCAHDIGVGGNNAIWIIGCDRAPRGFGIWVSRPASPDAGATDSSWTRVEGAGVAIAVDAQGQPWTLDVEGRVYRRPE